MKILYLCADSGIPFWGTKGGSIHMREFVGALDDAGSEVTVIANSRDRQASDNSIKVIDLPDPQTEQLLSMTSELTDDHKINSELRDYFRNGRIENMLFNLNNDICFDLIYERYSLFSIAGLRFARKTGIPFVLEVNSPLILEASRYRRLVFSELAEAVEKYLFGYADHIIAVSDEMRDYILKAAPDAKVTVVPNGVRVEHFRAEDSGQSSSEHSGDFVIGFVGNLRPWHGVEILIDSFALMSRTNQNCRLLIIGKGGRLAEQLEKKCGELGLDDKVEFTGAVDYDKIPPFLRRADVLTAPYPDIPGFYFSALKIFEYMAAGKAIVASEIGQISQILTHEKTALIVPPGDIRALANALTRLLKDKKLRNELGRTALLEARTMHTWKQRLQTVTGLFEDLITEKKGKDI